MYVRMSTDHQKYSTENQAEVINTYAERNNIDIVIVYADSGKSGLTIEGRDELQKLINDVQSGTAIFNLILVLDVTRWGRFQDADESAYYEYICRRAGIDVEYVAEQFTNDGSPVSTIIKSVKRSMAGEYSRELSGKVFGGQCTLIEKGYKQGGPAGFGLRRMLIDEHGQPKGILKRKERKSLQDDRVVLIPGPQEEIKIVQWMYHVFTKEGMNETDKRNLIEGICPEVVDMLKDKIVPIQVFPILRKMKAMRQIEATTLMCDAQTYSVTYAKALLAATPKEQLLDPAKPKKIRGLDNDQMERMESEMLSLQREYKLIEENYGLDVLNLTLAKTYLTTLLGNVRIVRYLAQHQPEMLAQFQKIADMDSLEKEAA